MTRRIVHVIDRLGVGGAEYLLVTAAQQAAAAGWELHVVSLGEAPQSPVPAMLADLDVPVIPVISSARRTLFDVARARRLREVLRSLRPDVVHTHLAYSNTLGPLLAPSSVPVVATLHNTMGGQRDGQEHRDRLEGWSLRHRVDLLIGVGPAVAQQQQLRLGRPVEILPNPVSPLGDVPAGAIGAARDELLGRSPGPLLLAAGRLTEQKAFDDLLRAFSVVVESSPGAVLALAGRGHLRDPLEKLAADLGIAASVRFLGPRDDLRVLMRAADLMVSSSRWEGLPLVLLEVMDAGTPLVATDVGDVRYAVGDTAVLVPPAQPEVLAAAVTGLLADPGRAGALAEAARARVAERHSPAVWASAADALYSRVAGAR